MAIIALVVGNSASPTAADIALRGRIEAAGHTLLGSAYTDDSTTPTVGTYDGVVICESVAASNVTTRYRDVTVPVITMEGGLYDDNRLGPTNAVTTTTQWSIQSVSGLDAGLSGTTTVSTSSVAYHQTLSATPGMGTGRQVVAQVVGDTTRSMYFVYESGSSMVGAVAAPARRVGLGITEAAMVVLNANGTALLDAAIAWAFPPALLEKTGSEAFALTESATVSVTTVASDTLALTETALISENKIGSEEFSLAELAQITITSSQSDTFDITETPSESIDSSQVDEFSFTDISDVLQLEAVVATETFDFVEQSVQITENRFPTDEFSLSETALVVEFREVIVFDTLNVVEDLSISAEAFRTDNFALAETKDIVNAVGASDSIGFSETVDSISTQLEVDDIFQLLVEYLDNGQVDLPDFVYGTVMNSGWIHGTTETIELAYGSAENSNKMRTDISQDEIVADIYR